MNTDELNEFAKRYTAAWCSQRAASVAAFFAERGSLKINDGLRSEGRGAITAAVQEFMTAFPDLCVKLDRLTQSGAQARYHWTLTGTHAGPGGSGKFVRISGSERWRFDPNGLIAESVGQFDAADYERQLGVLPTRNVIFDFGGVLVRWRPQEIIESFYQDERLRRLVQETVFGHPDWTEWDRGGLSDEAAVSRFSARMRRPVEEMRALMEHARQSLDAMHDSHDIVRSLAERGVPLYGLSNMSRSTFAHLKDRDAVFAHFRGIVISADIELVKPDPRIFAHICREFGLIPAETVFIDDLLPNIEAARALGFRTIHFTDAAQCASELRALGIESGSDPL